MDNLVQIILVKFVLAQSGICGFCHPVGKILISQIVEELLCGELSCGGNFVLRRNVL